MQPGETEQQGAAAPDAPTRTCEACGAPMEAAQDWCLECGTAAPGRLGAKPGMRAAATVVAMTLALVGGAVAASYAALSGDASEEAGKPAPPSGAPVAQVPTTPPGAVPGLTGPNPETLTNPPATTAPPGITTPNTATSPSLVPRGQVPKIPNVPSITPQTTFPGSTTPQTQTTTPSTTTTTPSTTTTTPSTTTTQPTTTTPAKPAGPQPITLAADAASLYDPSKRVTAQKGEPAKAIDGKPSTSWSVSTGQAGRDMAVGMVIDLKSTRSVRVLELATSTPGFRVEIYASDSDELPPDVLDTRWAHITDRSNVDQTAEKDRNKEGDGKERIVLGGGSAKYRYVLLWFTTPPEGGPTVRLSEVKLSG